MLESLYQGNYKDPEFDSPASYYKKALAFLKLDTAFNFRSISMYVKKTWFYKDHIEIKKYHTSRYGVKGEKRDRKCKPTDEAVKKANERNAVAKLRRLLENNFEAGDHHMVLTYKAESRPDPEEAKKSLQPASSHLTYILTKVPSSPRLEAKPHPDLMALLIVGEMYKDSVFLQDEGNRSAKFQQGAA